MGSIITKGGNHGTTGGQATGDGVSQLQYVETDPIKETMKPSLETTADFFERVQRESSFTYRFEKIPHGRKLELINFNAKKYRGK